MARPARDQFESWVHEHHAAVYASARRILPQGADAEDVTQQVYLRVLEGKDGIGAAGDARAVLRWLATRLALNRLRTVRRRERHELRRPAREEQEDPMGIVADADEQRRVDAALRALPDELRLPLVLRFQEGRTVEEVSECLSIAKSTAHERVQRGLDRLRHTLARAGIAVVPARLAEVLGAIPSPSVPAALQRALLALTPASASLGALALKVGAACSLFLGALGLWSLRPTGDEASIMSHAVASESRGGDPMRVEEPRDVSSDPPFSSRVAVVEPALAPAAEPSAAMAIVRGSVRDARGVSVANASVLGCEPGKGMPIHATTHTDADGRFRLELPLRGPDLEIVLSVFVYGSPGQRRSEPFRVCAGDDNGAHDLELSAAEGYAATRWTLAVTVEAPDGTPAGNVVVSVRPDPAPDLVAAMSVDAITDAAGAVSLEGLRTGPGTLVVDGRSIDAQRVVEEIDPRAGDALHRRVRLPAGLVLMGGVVSYEPGLAHPPADTARVFLEDDESKMRHDAQVARDGSFTFRDLDSGSYTLRAKAEGYSPARVPGVRAGAASPILRLKAEDDVRDVGDHMAEVHGSLNDARTGKMLRIGPFDLDHHAMIEGESTLACDLASPTYLQAQTLALDDAQHDAFHVVGLEPGRHLIVVRKEGYATRFFPVTLAEHEIASGVRIELTQGAVVRGRARDTNGAAVSDAHVFVVGMGATADAHITAWEATERGSKGPWPIPSLLAAQARSDDGGAFELRGVPTGVSLRVVAVHKDHERDVSAPLIFGEGAVTQVDLRLAARRD